MLPAIIGGILKHSAELTGEDHELLGHTAAIDAGAAHVVILRHSHFGTVLGGNACGTNPTGTTADDEIIKIVSH